MNITGQDLIHACSAIGAGIALIAGIGPGDGQSIAARPMPRRPGFIVLLLPFSLCSVSRSVDPDMGTGKNFRLCAEVCKGGEMRPWNG